MSEHEITEPEPDEREEGASEGAARRPEPERTGDDERQREPSSESK